MKKITLILVVLGVTFGYSQNNLPFTFTDGGSPTLHGFSAGDGAVISNTTDPLDGSNDVMSIVGNGTDWDNAQVVFASNIDLSDDGNNTISFRVKRTVNDGNTHTHALKFELGTTGDTELTFTTEDDQWKNISLDFPAGLGNYGRMVFFADFGAGNADTGTYLIDDIVGPGHLELPVFALPADFSDPVVHEMIGGDGAGVSIITDPADAGNQVLEIQGNGTNWDHAQANFANPIDLSDNDNNTIRFRIRSTTSGGINEHLLKFEGGVGADPELTFESNGQAWQDIELDYPAGLNSYAKIVIMVDWGGGPTAAAVETYLVDDISIGATVLSVNDFDIADFNVYPNPSRDSWNIKTDNTIINAVSVFDVLGKQVISLTPESTDVKIDASSLTSGLYIAKIATPNGVSNIRLVRK